MPRHLLALVSSSTLVAVLSTTVSAQSPTSAPVFVGHQAAVRGGRVFGSVSDEAGRALPGVSIMAVGGRPLAVLARSDATGQFMLQLPPGEYILRAAREGYVSTYREPVRIQSSTELQRNIILIRELAPAHEVVLRAAPDLEPLAGTL